MGKIRLAKKIKTEKKSQKELLYTTQMAHLYGGSKISRTSNSSNSSNRNSSSNNSNFGGSDLAGPPVTMRQKYVAKVPHYAGDTQVG